LKAGGTLDNKDQKQIVPQKRNGFFEEVSLRVKLILRLLRDRRVNPLLKFLPIGTFLYFLVPDLLPGPIDDGLIMWLGGTLFVELCPPQVVQEHMDALTQVVDGEWREVDE
jgi:hypothetical protein